MDLEILAYISAALMLVLAFLAYRYWRSTAAYARRVQEAHAHQVVPPLQFTAPMRTADVVDVLPDSHQDDDGDVTAADKAESVPDLDPTDQTTGFEALSPDASRGPLHDTTEDAAPADDFPASELQDTTETLRQVPETALRDPPGGDAPASAGSESTGTAADGIAPELHLPSQEGPFSDDSENPAPTRGQIDPGDDPEEQSDQADTIASTEDVEVDDAEGPAGAVVPPDGEEEEEDRLEVPAYRLIDELESPKPSSRAVDVSRSVAALLKELDEKLEALPSGIEVIDMPVLERRRIADRREELLSNRQTLLEQKKHGANRRRRSRLRLKRQST